LSASAAIIEWRRNAVQVRNNELMTESIEFFGGDAWLDVAVNHL
jgi:hypothetical protein